MNLPNKITIVRILMVPIFMVVLYLPFQTSNVIAFFIFAIAAFTDSLDGHIARSRNLVTNFGKFLDPLADKLLVAAALIALVGMGMIPSWFATIIIAREFMVTGIRLLANGEGRVIAASIWGKIKTITQIIAILLLLLDTYKLAENDIFMIYKLKNMFVNFMTSPVENTIGILSTIMIILAVIITVFSGIDYLVKNKDVLKLEDC